MKHSQPLVQVLGPARVGGQVNVTDSFTILADQVAMSAAEFPLLVVDLYEEPGRTFRAISAQIQGIENNLSISNMDFAEFAAAVDEDGIFRGFHNG